MIKSFFKNNFPLLLVLSSSAFLRLYHLDFQSLWDDEIVTMIESDPTLRTEEAYDLYYQFDNMPPLYFLLQRYLFILFGYSSIVLRAFPAILGIISVFALYKLGKEIATKNVGLFAASFLSVNYFHVFYSQEARPYSFLILFTILSFYFLILFIKKQSLKNLFLYSLSATLMLYGQYLAIATLIGQFVILFYFLLVSHPSKRIRLFLKSSLSLIFIILAYLPSLHQFIKNNEIKSSWIPPCKGNEYSDFLFAFFGNSEMIMPLIYILILVYFIYLSSEKSEEIESTDTLFGSLKFSFIILISWLFFSLLIPLMRSYMVLPILIPRYFTHLIPAVVLLAAIGLEQFKSQFIKAVFFTLVLLFSLNDLFIVKNYYQVPTKTQFRESSAFINEHKTKDDRIVARIGLHYGLFFKENTKNNTFYWYSLDKHVSVILNDTSIQKPFWYAAVNENKPEIHSTRESIFKNRYYINLKSEYPSSSATHFQPLPINWMKIDIQNNPTGSSINDALTLNGSFSVHSQNLDLTKGIYTLNICAKSSPQIKVNGINAHISIKIGDKVVGGCFLNENYYSTKKIKFYIPQNINTSLEMVFDNPLFLNGQERSLSLLSALLAPN